MPYSIDSFGSALNNNGGNSTFGSNRKLYFHGAGERGFYGNQYVKATKLTQIGARIGKYTGPMSMGIRGIEIGYGLYCDYKTYKATGPHDMYNTASAAGRVAGGWIGGTKGALAGAWLGTKVGTVIGGMFGGAGAVPGAIIGATVFGIAGAFGGEWLGGYLVDTVYGR